MELLGVAEGEGGEFFSRLRKFIRSCVSKKRKKGKVREERGGERKEKEMLAHVKGASACIEKEKTGSWACFKGLNKSQRKTKAKKREKKEASGFFPGSTSPKRSKVSTEELRKESMNAKPLNSRREREKEKEIRGP